MMKKVLGVPRGAWLAGIVIGSSYVPNFIPSLHTKLEEAIKLVAMLGVLGTSIKDHKHGSDVAEAKEPSTPPPTDA